MTTTSMKQEHSAWERDYASMTEDHASWRAERDRLKTAITILQNHLSEHDVYVARHDAAMARHQNDIATHAGAIESGKLASLDLRHEANAKEHGELKSEHALRSAIHKDVMSIVTRIEAIHPKHATVKTK